jgi:nitrate reductase gamma subunit
MELLDFARGDALTISIAIFVLGVLWRLSTMLFAPRLRVRAPARDYVSGDATLFVQGVLTRFWPHKKFERNVLINHLNGYVFHLGLFIVVFFYRPHILFIESLIGITWPALPNTVIYGIGMVTLISLVLALIRRLTNPPQKLLSTFNDYFSWAITVLPVLTGLLAVSNIGPRYETLLALHILSVCALLIWLPFGKLMHTFTFILSRGTTAVRLKRRGTVF